MKKFKFHFEKIQEPDELRELHDHVWRVYLELPGLYRTPLGKIAMYKVNFDQCKIVDELLYRMAVSTLIDQIEEPKVGAHKEYGPPKEDDHSLLGMKRYRIIHKVVYNTYPFQVQTTWGNGWRDEQGCFSIKDAEEYCRKYGGYTGDMIPVPEGDVQTWRFER